MTLTKSPLEQTIEEQAALAKGAIDGLEHAWRRCKELVWHNPYGLTPQEVVAKYGVDAQAVFLESYQIGELLKAHGRDVDNTPPMAYTANADGSITLT